MARDIGARPAITPLRGHHKIVSDGTTIPHGTPLVVVVSLAGCSRWRIRVKVTGDNATMSAVYRRSGRQADVYDTDNPGNVALVAGTANKMQEDFHRGEEALELTITTASGTATIAHLDAMTV